MVDLMYTGLPVSPLIMDPAEFARIRSMHVLDKYFSESKSELIGQRDTLLTAVKNADFLIQNLQAQIVSAQDALASGDLEALKKILDGEQA